MGLNEDLKSKVQHIFSSRWDTSSSRSVPSDTSIGLEGNKGIYIEATVMYADLSGSTRLVDCTPPEFAACIYKAYLHCAAKIIKSQGGEITAYDGDRIMAVFVGEYKNSSAVLAAMKINWAVKNIINPLLVDQKKSSYKVAQVVGIDTSKLFVAKTGVRGANDLVWVGRAANYAAKLANEKGYPIFITEDVYKVLSNDAKLIGECDIWHLWPLSKINGVILYCSDAERCL